MRKFLAIAALLFASATQAAITTIDFEAIPDGGTVSNQYPGAVFSSSGTTVQVSAYSQASWGTAAPRIACPLGSNLGYCSASLIVDFTSPLTALQFLFTGDNFAGIVGVANYFNGATLLASQDLLADGNALSSHLESYANASGITRLVVNVSSAEAALAGLGYDDFVLTTGNTVPEPATLALMLTALGMVAWGAKRRT
ncbi:MAG: PEP-CTERM sorting domain-containing protein [Burkholderiales bacterium]